MTEGHMHIWNKTIKDTYYMNNSGLIHVAVSIKLHSPEIVETSGHGSVANWRLEGWKLTCSSVKYRAQKQATSAHVQTIRFQDYNEHHIIAI